jgi:hypothetical protein
MPQVEQKFERWNENVHPASERCEGSAGDIGQCPYCKIEGTNYCARHGGAVALNNQKQQRLRNYRLTKYQARVGQFADNDALKSLREEVGILRMIMEEMLNQCENATDILLYSTRMADLVMKIEKLVTSCDKMESKMGLLLSRDSVLQLAGEYIAIISDHVEDQEIIEEISMKMVQATMRIQDPVEADKIANRGR